jgi:hypothetical protein
LRQPNSTLAATFLDTGTGPGASFPRGKGKMPAFEKKLKTEDITRFFRSYAEPPI